MKSSVFATFVAVTMGLSSSAFAATSVLGTVEKLDAATRQLTLTDGAVYNLAEGIKVEGLKAGDHVALVWDQVGSAKEIASYAPVKAGAAATVGAVKSIDTATHQLTLMDGAVYQLPSDMKVGVMKPGDAVSLVWQTVGTSKEIVSISPASGGAKAVSGEITAIDAATHQITLHDGTVYQLPKGMKEGGYKVGDKVSVLWQEVGTAKDVVAISPAA